VRKLLIVGATSAIAQATARLHADHGDQIYLAGRDVTRLQQVADDLIARGADKVGLMAIDLTHEARHTELLDAAHAHMDGLDTVLIAHGTLPNQTDCEADFELAREAIDSNFMSAAALLTQVAQRFSSQGHGTIAAIGSVAGDRGRASNYIYGSAKGALEIFLSGLRNRLNPQGIRVVTIKPGFVDTPMTADLPKGPLWASPDKIARGIYKSMSAGPEVVYLPEFWRLIMLIIKLLPEPLFKRLKL